jgi:RNA polymerase sigma-70 factor (ECF subfamily)
LPEDGSGRRAPDDELVRRARRGDDAASDVLVNRHAGRLYGLALRLVGNAADAEDVVQETFLGAFRGLRGFRGHASVKTWLTRILVNRVARLHRSRRLRRATPIHLVLEPSGDAVPDAATAEVRADIRMDLSAVLAGLSDEHRTVVVLRELQGMSYSEMADALDVPRGTVESRLFRARQRLKELLKDYLP